MIARWSNCVPCAVAEICLRLGGEVTGAFEVAVLGFIVEAGADEEDDEGDEGEGNDGALGAGGVAIDVLGVTIGKEEEDDEGDEGEGNDGALGAGGVAIDVLGVTIGKVEEDDEGDEGEENDGALGAGGVAIDVLGVATGKEEEGEGNEEDEVGNRRTLGAEATGADDAGATEGAGVTDELGATAVYVTFLTTFQISSQKYRDPRESTTMPPGVTGVNVALLLSPSVGSRNDDIIPVPATVVIMPVLAVTFRMRLS